VLAMKHKEAREMRVGFIIVVAIAVLVLALGALEAIGSRLPVAKPLPNSPASETWYWR